MDCLSFNREACRKRAVIVPETVQTRRTVCLRTATLMWPIGRLDFASWGCIDGTQFLVIDRVVKTGFEAERMAALGRLRFMHLRPEPAPVPRDTFLRLSETVEAVRLTADHRASGSRSVARPRESATSGGDHTIAVPPARQAVVAAARLVGGPGLLGCCTHTRVAETSAEVRVSSRLLVTGSV